MNEVAVIVEGQTEQQFVNGLLQTHLGGRGLRIWARLSGRIERQGGVRQWSTIRKDIVRALLERPGRYCTTMFDFYGLPHDWPGRTEASGKSRDQKGPCVEKALLADFREFSGKDFRSERFVPYVQVHEFEALLFADVDRTAEALNASPGGSVDLAARLRAVLEEAGEPEAINDRRDLCPSRRITALAPGYRKAIDGPVLAARIGLDAMRKACPHFGQWLDRLEALATAS